MRRRRLREEDAGGGGGYVTNQTPCDYEAGWLKPAEEILEARLKQSWKPG